MAVQKQASQTGHDPLWTAETDMAIFLSRRDIGPHVPGHEFRDAMTGRLIGKILKRKTDLLELGDEDGNLIARVKRNPASNDGASSFDHYAITLFGKQGAVQSLRLEQSPLLGKFKLYENDQVVLKCKNRTVPSSATWCVFLTFCGYLTFTFEYYRSPDSNNTKEVKFIRNQSKEKIKIRAGTSPLLALCVAYATDRLIGVQLCRLLGGLSVPSPRGVSSSSSAVHHQKPTDDILTITVGRDYNIGADEVPSQSPTW